MRVEVLNNLKHDGQVIPKGVAIDLDDAIVNALPEGTVRPLRPLPDFIALPATLKEPIVLKGEGPTFEEWVDGGKDKTKYPPDGYGPIDTPAWRAYVAAMKVQQDVAPVAHEIQPHEPLSSGRMTGVQPKIREIK